MSVYKFNKIEGSVFHHTKDYLQRKTNEAYGYTKILAGITIAEVFASSLVEETFNNEAVSHALSDAVDFTGNLTAAAFVGATIVEVVKAHKVSD